MRTLIIVAREPIPGQTKTRLCPPLDGTTAAALSACFLRDVLALVRQIPGVQPVIAYTPTSAAAYFAQLAPDIPAWPQHGANLGERLDNALQQALASTAAANPAQLPSAVAIGSDHPDLPLAYLHNAFTLLDNGADLVLGPADDGGYYLIGLRTPQPRLLREVPMSTPTVLADTLALANGLALRTALLPEWYDIDTAADLRRLQVRLAQANPETAPTTRAFLQQLVEL